MSLKQFFLETPTKHFFSVEFFLSEREMFSAITRLGKKKPARDIRALCLRYVAQARDKNQELYTTPEIGTIFFLWQDRQNMAVIVHELTHAAVGYFNRIGKNFHDDEELAAETVQSFVEQYREKL